MSVAMMPRAPVLGVLACVFALTAMGRGGAALASLEDPDDAKPAPTFSEMDQWSAELDEREVAVEAVSIAAEIAGAEARRMAARAVPPTIDPGKSRKLAALYAAMPPDKAASVLAALDTPEAASVLGAMAPTAAGAVMGAMPGDAALRLGTALSD